MSVEAARRIVVARSVVDSRRGMIRVGGLVAPCALGRSGVATRKREGDGATPAGRLGLVAVLYRPDRTRRPSTALPATPLRPDSGWCDDPTNRAYNRPVRLPFAGGHEKLWRNDHLYDIVVVLDFNLDAPRLGAGSAVFLHIARHDFGPTEGCVAVSETTMRRLLANTGRGAYLDIT